MLLKCFTCCETQHKQQISELRGEVEALSFELSQLKSQLQPPQPPVSPNKIVEHYLTLRLVIIITSNQTDCGTGPCFSDCVTPSLVIYVDIAS